MELLVESARILTRITEKKSHGVRLGQLVISSLSFAIQFSIETRATMRGRARKRDFFIGAALAALIAALGVGQSVLQNRADAQGRTVQAPMFEVDPLWPKPLPNHWLLGWTIGLWVDE